MVLSNILFGNSQLSLLLVIIILEWILCAYGIGMAVYAKNKVIIIIHIALCVLWGVCAILNMVNYFSMM